MRKLTVLAIHYTLVPIVLFAGCSSTHPRAVNLASEKTAEASERWAYETPSELRTLTDHLVLGTVTSIVDPEPPDSMKQLGEGHQIRDVTFTVEKVLWSRPGANTAPRSVAVHPLLEYKDGVQAPIRFAGSPLWRTNTSYVFSVLEFRGTWSPVGNAGMFELDDNGVIVAPSDAVGSQLQFAGKPYLEFVAFITATPPIIDDFAFIGDPDGRNAALRACNRRGSSCLLATPSTVTDTSSSLQTTVPTS
jgi:hypothetical protein